MPVPFKAVARVNPADRTQPPLYYAQPVKRGTLTLRQLAKRASDMSSITVMDALSVIESLVQIIPEELGEGNIVRLGEFGSFSLSIKCEPAETPEALKSPSINGAKIIFRPGKIVKEKLEVISYEKVS